MPARRPLETIPVEAFLDQFPPPNRELAERLRAIVQAAVPDASERVRAGWPQGSFLDDRRGMLEGAGITKRARWLTYQPGDTIDEAAAIELIRAAEGFARIPRGTLG